MVPRSDVSQYYAGSTHEAPVLVDPTKMNAPISHDQPGFSFSSLSTGKQ